MLDSEKIKQAKNILNEIEIVKDVFSDLLQERIEKGYNELEGRSALQSN